MNTRTRPELGRHRFLCAGILLSTIAYGSTASAVPMNGPALEDLTLTLVTPKNDTTDLHISISNSDPFAVTKSAKGPFSMFASINGSLNYAGANLDANTKVTVGVTTSSISNEFKIDAASWTHPSGPPDAIKVDGIDLKARLVGDPQVEFSIGNAGDSYYQIQNLSFLSNVNEIALDLPVHMTSLTFTPLTPSSVLLTPSSAPFDPSSHVFGPFDIDSGKFLYIEGDIFLSDSGGQLLSSSASFRFGHQAPIPEPMSSTLLTIGALGLILGRHFAGAKCQSFVES
jgi:hypothetical protein